MCLREISPLGPSREARSLSASHWAPQLFPTSGLVPSHIYTHRQTHARVEGGLFRGKVEVVGYSHHIGKVSLPCGSACARPVLFSGWRLCCTRCIYTASPAATHRYTASLKRALDLSAWSRTIHKTILPQLGHIWTKPGGRSVSIIMAYSGVL